MLLTPAPCLRILRLPSWVGQARPGPSSPWGLLLLCSLPTAYPLPLSLPSYLFSAFLRLTSLLLVAIINTVPGWHYRCFRRETMVKTDRRNGKPAECCGRCGAGLQGMYAFDIQEDTKHAPAGSVLCESCELRLQYMSKPPRPERKKRERKKRPWTSSTLLRCVSKVWPREDHLCITLVKRHDKAMAEVEIRDPDPDPHGNSTERIVQYLQHASELTVTVVGEGKVERSFPRFSYAWVRVRLEPPAGDSTAA